MANRGFIPLKFRQYLTKAVVLKEVLGTDFTVPNWTIPGIKSIRSVPIEQNFPILLFAANMMAHDLGKTEAFLRLNLIFVMTISLCLFRFIFQRART